MSPNFENISSDGAKNSESSRYEAQFSNPETIELANGESFDVVDIKPEAEKTETPTLWLPGWGATPEVHKENILHLAEAGRRTLAINAPHGIESTHLGNLSAEEQKIHDIELKKVAALLKVMDEKGIQQADIVGHSEGAIYGVSAALMQPERFRNIVLVDPAGMMGKDRTSRLLLGSALDAYLQTARMNSKKLSAQEAEKAKSQTKTANRVSREVFASKPLQTMKSIGVITSTQIHEALTALRNQGVGIAIVHAVDDKLFPMERIQKQTKKEMVSGFYSVQGTHNELYLHPEKYTALVDSALDALERLQKKPS